MLAASEIKWDVDKDEIHERVDDMSTDEFASTFKCPKTMCESMSEEERHDYADSYFRHLPGALYDFCELPEKVDIPAEIGGDEEDISNWLSDTYGYCHEGFMIEKMTY